MFSPGDRVRYVGTYRDNMPEYVGREGIVLRLVSGFSQQVLRIKWDQSREETTHFAANFVTAIAEIDETEAFFV